MKSVLKSIFACVVVMMAGRASAQTFTPINPPPCDFSDQFYGDNGVDPTQLVQRFGSARQFGPPATGTQANWVTDSTCATNDPTRRNFRILATTGGNADDGNSPFSNGTPETLEFISILAFLTNQTNFETTYSRTVGAISGAPAGETISIVNAANPRGIHMQDVVGFFEAYAATKQTTPNGFALNPCQVDMQAPGVPTTPCFDLGTVNAVFTPNLRQDWRFATNRNAIDGSDGNCINNTDQNCKHKTFSDSPYGYFCDDLLGMWIITYFWFTQPPNTTVQPCHDIFASIGAKNGFNLDGTPIILTATELNDQLEANGCGAEGQEAVDGTDGGAIWLICPAIPDPRNGAIAADAFLDAVRLPNGSFQDTFLAQNFTCLQQTGKFCSESAPEF
ncbi:MAG TPA: hypothetical protein VFQ41_08935 [Candidatus Angelobacter sp.]|nr:hypothetical protein [Candidatus Angelobacter sp.]